MVAQSCQVITGGVHQLDDGSALVHGAVSGALDVVAGVNQQNIVILLCQLCLYGSDDIVAQGIVDVGVYVVGVEDCDGLLNSGFSSISCRGLGGICSGLSRFAGAGGQAQNQNASHQNCKKFTHGNYLLF